MLLIITISALITGAIAGICLYRFHQNGWVPSKYLENEKAREINGREKNVSMPRHFSQHKGKRVYKAYAY